MVRSREQTAERTYRGIVDTMSEGAITISPSGTILYANPCLATLLGRPATDLIGARVLELTADAERDALARLLDVGDGESNRGEITLTAAGDVTVRVLLAVSGFELDGAPLRCLVMTDLSASRAAARALAESHEELRATKEQFWTLFDCAPVGIAHVSPAGEIVRTNPGFCALTGHRADELEGVPIEDLVHPGDQAMDRYNVARLLSGEADTYRIEMRYLRTNGDAAWVEAAGAILRDADHRPSMLVRVIRDITDARLASQYARSLLEASLDPLMTISPQGRITDVNDATSIVTDVPRDELIGSDFADYFTDPDLARKAYRRVFETGTVTDYPLTVRNGKLTPVLYNASLYRDPDGHVLGVFAAARDVTAQRRAEAEVAEFNAGLEARVVQRTTELELSNKSLEAFTYSVSHDLRAPLRALSGFSEALLDDYGDRLDDAGRNYAERIVAASERMARLIDDLLHLSRISRADMNLGTVDLSAEVEDIAMELEERDPERRVRFVIQDAVLATADRLLIRTVLENLMENAWKFTAKREKACIEFGAAPVADGAPICCYVRDDGAGFDPVYADKLFQPFQRLHSGNEFPGTGVGLASVRRIVERHGGHTWAEGAVDEGATFSFTLDAKDSP